MRILLIGPHFLGGWTESSQAALESLGHQVRKVYYDNAPNESRAIRLAAMSALWSSDTRAAIRNALGNLLLATKYNGICKLARNFSPHCIIVLKGETIPSKVLEELRSQINVPIVTWWVDDPFRFPDSVDISSLYDHFFVFDRYYVPQLERCGIKRVSYLPCACDPSIFHPMSLSLRVRRRYACDVAFVALFYPPRDQLVQQMMGLDLAIWGPGWNSPDGRIAIQDVGKNALRGRRLSSKRAAHLYNVAKVCINVHHSQSKLNGLNTRSLEIAACGGFQVVDHLPGIHELLIPGEEVVCYETYDQARELVEYYLPRSVARAEIGKRGRQRVLGEHTYTHRVTTMLSAINKLL